MQAKTVKQADKDLRERVQWVLDYDPEVRSTDVGVATDDGTVTLTGFVGSYAEKLAAERAAKRTYGVKAVANDIEVKPASKKTDTEVAAAAAAALEARVDVPEERVKVTVKSGWVYLDGTVDWGYQRDSAEAAVKKLTGVVGVTNNIGIMPKLSTKEVQRKIEEAIRHHAELDARRITVTAHDGTAELWGNVRSWAEKDEAERAAWSAPGVHSVKSHISIVP
ncbi:MAG TPA: BON domain-containing protein [Pyrinomonadaceae bacterium]|jgi:osmotically-inducible protein OsmY|nr:BON domain-containing protein [Pyrinomonadaceae bacterium]